MRLMIALLASCAGLAGCERAPDRPDAVQASQWAAEQNHRIQALETRVTALEAERRAPVPPAAPPAAAVPAPAH